MQGWDSVPHKRKPARVIKAHQLKPGDRFSFIPVAWYGPGVVTVSYGNRNYKPDQLGAIWTLKFDNSKVVNPPGVWYGNPDTKVRLLRRKRGK